MATTSETTTSQNIFLFELEGAALDGRSKVFEAAQQVFQTAGLALNDQAFARFCVHAAPSYIVEQLVANLGAGHLGEDAVARIVARYVELIRQAGLKPQPTFAAILAEARSRGMKAAALTALPEEAAIEVFKQSGLQEQGVELVLFPEDERHFPRTECWLRVPRANSRSARACIAVAGCRDAGRSALSAGMRCIVTPDRFTAYQDFSGVDAVIESLEDADLKALLEAIS